LRITTAGPYTFSLQSDEGSMMWLGEESIINNDGLHGMVIKTGTHRLPAALHAIRIDYFEKGGGAGCVFKYQGADTNNRN